MGAPAAPAAGTTTTPEGRKRAYLRSSVRVLRRNTPQLAVAAPVSPQDPGGGDGDGRGERGGGGRWRSKLPPAPLADVSVRQLLKELSEIVDPPRKLPRFKVHLRRAPTQEVRKRRADTPCTRRRACVVRMDALCLLPSMDGRNSSVWVCVKLTVRVKAGFVLEAHASAGARACAFFFSSFPCEFWPRRCPDVPSCFGVPTLLPRPFLVNPP